MRAPLQTKAKISSSAPPTFTPPRGRLLQREDRIAQMAMQSAIPKSEVEKRNGVGSRTWEAPVGKFLQVWANYDEPKDVKKEGLKDTEKGQPCNVTLLDFKGTTGSVHFYAIPGQHVLQAGKAFPKAKDNQPGVAYTGKVLVKPKDCAELEFVQNAKANEVITFKDKSQLKKTTTWLLDEDPYPIHPLIDPTENVKAGKCGDCPGFSTAGADAEIDNIAVKDQFRLFLMVRAGENRKAIGLANWSWEAKVATTEKEKDTALLVLESSSIGASDGESAGAAKPLEKGTPRIADQTFMVVGEGENMASRWVKRFK